MENKQWELLSDSKSDIIWKNVYKTFNFNPSTDTKTEAYSMPFTYDLYDCSNAIHFADTNINWTITIQNIIAHTLNDDSKKIYALTWKHDNFWYDPNIAIDPLSDPLDNSNIFMEIGDNRLYLPSFYPDGEYYIFLDPNFKWGYLTDPWRKHIYVYGDILRLNIRNYSKYLKLNLIDSIN